MIYIKNYLFKFEMQKKFPSTFSQDCTIYQHQQSKCSFEVANAVLENCEKSIHLVHHINTPLCASNGPEQDQCPHHRVNHKATFRCSDHTVNHINGVSM